jgi:hypothetical protein
MALNDNTLGGGAALSGTAAPGRTDELNVCSSCGFEATTAIEGKDGLTYALCAGCEVMLREQEAEEEEEWEEVLCADCGKVPAECRFVHLWKGEFWLCRSCWYSADHEDDYLDVCGCWPPIHEQGEDKKVHCAECNRDVKYIIHCECPIPSTLSEHPNHCVFCRGAVLRLSDEEGDKLHR